MRERPAREVARFRRTHASDSLAPLSRPFSSAPLSLPPDLLHSPSHLPSVSLRDRLSPIVRPPLPPPPAPSTLYPLSPRRARRGLSESFGGCGFARLGSAAFSFKLSHVSPFPPPSSIPSPASRSSLHFPPPPQPPPSPAALFCTSSLTSACNALPYIHSQSSGGRYLVPGPCHWTRTMTRIWPGPGSQA